MLKRVALAISGVRQIRDDLRALWGAANSTRETVTALQKAIESERQKSEHLARSLEAQREAQATSESALQRQVEAVRALESQIQTSASSAIRSDRLYIPTEVFAGTAQGDYMAYSVPVASDCLHPVMEQFVKELRHSVQIHRKLWEFAYIAHHLKRKGALAPGMRGVGFGVGEEPLAAYFAKQGCHIVATDAPAEVVAREWIETGQYSSGLDKLARPEILDLETFRERVSFEESDMNAIGGHLTGFDFCWSAGSLEHLGSLQHGIDFIINSVEKTLKVGGVACHTTELNLSSDSDTLETKLISLYRRSDLERLIEALRERGHEVDPLALTPGTSPIDYIVDVPPYTHNPHLKLQSLGHVTTSVGLVIRRGR